MTQTDQLDQVYMEDLSFIFGYKLLRIFLQMIRRLIQESVYDNEKHL